MTPEEYGVNVRLSSDLDMHAHIGTLTPYTRTYTPTHTHGCTSALKKKPAK